MVMRSFLDAFCWFHIATPLSLGIIDDLLKFSYVNDALQPKMLFSKKYFF
jgi:hypothetical protein